jgi:hypothetical protein
MLLGIRTMVESLFFTRPERNSNIWRVVRLMAGAGCFENRFLIDVGINHRRNLIRAQSKYY